MEILPFVPFSVLSYQITPLMAAHDPAECCLIYLIEDEEGKTLLYGNDTAYFPEETWSYLKRKRLDFVSLDCTMGVLEDGKTHMGWKGCVRTKKRLISMGCVHEKTIFMLNHFSHNCGHGISHAEMEHLAETEGFQVSWDGRSVIL